MNVAGSVRGVHNGTPFERQERMYIMEGSDYDVIQPGFARELGLQLYPSPHDSSGKLARDVVISLQGVNGAEHEI
eukprot:1838356-Rhodomonas_salina.1